MSLILQGSTSGSITLQEPAVAGTTVLTLPAVTGTVLTDTSPKAGNVIQVIQGTATNASTTSSTFVTTGLAATITPSSSSSRILVIVTLVQLAVSTQNLNGTSTIFRGATNIAPTGSGLHKCFATNYSASGGAIAANQTYSYLDSPSTTSATTYTIYFAVDSGGTITMGVNSNTSYIQLLEIAG
jgi:predicted outer membrane repeat protein